MASKLYDSRLSSSHHYYIVFFEAKEIGTIDELYKIFQVKKTKESISILGSSQPITHFQLELPVAYGSRVLLAGNESRMVDGVQNYWYDFYAGEIQLRKKRFFFISYPYVRLGKYIEACFFSNRIRRTLYKPEMPEVMKFMKEHDGTYVFSNEKMRIDISKYAAKVLDDTADKVHISGKNPLNSTVFKILNESNSVEIETTALKMSCYIPDVGKIELSFDRLGNYRFWIPYKHEISTFSTLPSVLKFFDQEKLLIEDTFFNTYTLLEDDKD
jgi:hypothetical protein